jgi:hypothetical protein
MGGQVKDEGERGRGRMKREGRREKKDEDFAIRAYGL